MQFMKYRFPFRVTARKLSHNDYTKPQILHLSTTTKHKHSYYAKIQPDRKKKLLNEFPNLVNKTTTTMPTQTKLGNAPIASLPHPTPHHPLS